MTRDEIPIVSLFSGCGGMDVGFRQHGFIPIVAIDNASDTVATYNLNHGAGIAQQGDLSKLSGEDVIKLIEKVAPGIRPRGMIGGPPCQSFSSSNVHGKPRDPRHRLPVHYAHILAALNKKYHLDFFVLENVVGLKSKKHERRYGTILRVLEEAGFNIFEQELDAKWFDVPQSRHRIFVVGINKQLYPQSQFTFPEGNQETVLTVRDAIAGLPKPIYFRRGLSRDDIPFHHNHWTMKPRSVKFKSGGKKARKNGRSFRRLRWGWPSWTVAYGHREIHIHPSGRRRLSIFEAMRLQGFPDTYELLGNFSQQVTQVSNAVPPPVASALAQSIKKTLYDPQHEITRRLIEWFDANQRRFAWVFTRR